MKSLINTIRKTILKSIFIIYFTIKSIPLAIVSPLVIVITTLFYCIKFSFIDTARNAAERNATEGMDNLFNKYDLW